MNETLYMILALIAGLMLGTLFFGGLWFTVKKAVDSKKPAIWFFVSSLFAYWDHFNWLLLYR